MHVIYTRLSLAHRSRGSSCPPLPPRCTAQPVLLRSSLPRGTPCIQSRGGAKSSHVGRPGGKTPCTESDGWAGILFLPNTCRSSIRIRFCCRPAKHHSTEWLGLPGRRRREGGAVGRSPCGCERACQGHMPRAAPPGHLCSVPSESGRS